LNGGGGDDAGDTTTAESVANTDDAVQTTAADASATTVADAGRTCGASGRCVGISDIEVVNGRYIVSYSFEGFDNVIGSSDQNFHLHFVWNSIPVSEAGVPVDGTPRWQIWDLQMGGGLTEFDFFTDSNVAEFGGETATGICVAVARFDHSIEQDTFYCRTLD
jgi:hypothetical protein